MEALASHACCSLFHRSFIDDVRSGLSPSESFEKEHTHDDCECATKYLRAFRFSNVNAVSDLVDQRIHLFGKCLACLFDLLFYLFRFLAHWTSSFKDRIVRSGVNLPFIFFAATANAMAASIAINPVIERAAAHFGNQMSST